MSCDAVAGEARTNTISALEAAYAELKRTLDWELRRTVQRFAEVRDRDGLEAAETWLGQRVEQIREQATR